LCCSWALPDVRWSRFLHGAQLIAAVRGFSSSITAADESSAATIYTTGC
jgi:hypothetical protein